MGRTSWYSLPRSSPSPIVTPSHRNSRVRPTKLAPRRLDVTLRCWDPSLLRQTLTPTSSSKSKKTKQKSRTEMQLEKR